MAYNRIVYTPIGGGSFSFPYVILKTDQLPEYGENGIDFLGTRYTFSIAGTVTAQTHAEFQTLLFQMRCALPRPRGGLSIQWSPTGLDGSWVDYYSFEVDDDWGPKPGRLSIVDFHGGLAANYHTTFEVFRKECFASGCTVGPMGTIGSAYPNVLSISRRWVHTVDAVGLTTRNVSGTLVVSSLNVTQRKDADFYRALVTGPIPANFHREQELYERSPNGRELRFSITDREVMYTLPQPISRANGVDWRVRSRGMTAVIDMTLTGEFEAPPSHSKQEILQQIGLLVLDRFPTNTIWDSREIVDSIYENKLRFAFSGHAGAAVDPNGNPGWLVNVGKAPPGSNGQSQPIGAYGSDGSQSSGVKASVPRPYDACVGGDTSLDDGTIPSGGQTSFGPGLTRPGDPGNSFTPGDISNDHAVAPYIHYHERYRFEIDPGIVPLYPMAKGKAPIFQQVRNPRVRLIQSGSAIRDGTLAQVPAVPPPFWPQSHPVLNAAYEPSNSEPLGVAGQYRHTVRWTYALEYNGDISGGSFETLYPKDPRSSQPPPTLVGGSHDDSSVAQTELNRLFATPPQR